MIQSLANYAYCGGLLVDKHSPINGAYRITSVTISSFLMCIYFCCIRLLYEVFDFKINEHILYIILSAVIFIGWLGLKKWQLNRLHSSENIVNNAFSKRKIKWTGIICFIISLCSIFVVVIVSILTLEGYTYWK